MFFYPKYKYFLLVFDLLIILGSIYFSIFITKISVNKAVDFNILNQYTHVIIIFLSSILIAFFKINNLYKSHIIFNGGVQVFKLIRSLFYWITLIILISFVFKIFFFDFFRTIVLFTLLISFSSYFILRIIIFRWLFSHYYKTPLFKWKVLIIGGGKSGKELAEKIENEKNGLQIVGFLDDNIPVDKKIFEEKVNLGKVESLFKIICNHNIDEVIIAINNIDYLRFTEIIKLCKSSRVSVKINSTLFEVIPNKIPGDPFSISGIIPASPSINSNINMIVKRIFDLVVSIFLLIVLLPIFLIICVLIKLGSKGPVLYTQERIGKNGKIFKIFKFRSMFIGSDQDKIRERDSINFVNGNTNKNTDTKIVTISNITRIGRLMRKYSIDEFPQLINVVKNDMSIVGPRPYLSYESDKLNQWQLERTRINPGCTGVWQVYGRSNVSFKDSVILDLYYIYNISLWLDLRIMLNTIPVIIMGTGGS